MKRIDIHRGLYAALLCAALCFLGCASAATSRQLERYSLSIGERAAATARAMTGKPYRYGGDNPSGFDCSGLVRYSYSSAGMELPHNTGFLRQHSEAVPSRDLREGDLVFFNQEGKKSSHVGIFIGGSNFVHAPSSGKSVRVDSLEDAYWEKHFVDGRRLY